MKYVLAGSWYWLTKNISKTWVILKIINKYITEMAGSISEHLVLKIFWGSMTLFQAPLKDNSQNANTPLASQSHLHPLVECDH